jgi:hypothetical protein
MNHIETELLSAQSRIRELEQDNGFAGEIMGKICIYGTLVSGERPVDPPPHAAIDAILAQIDRAEKAEAERDELKAKLDEINTPETDDFFAGIEREAAHQRLRWSSEHDAGKTHADWFWLVGYLAGKCLNAAISGNDEKALHHTISTAAALANWHRAIKGFGNMRPGIDTPAEAGLINETSEEAK